MILNFHVFFPDTWPLERWAKIPDVSRKIPDGWKHRYNLQITCQQMNSIKRKIYIMDLNRENINRLLDLGVQADRNLGCHSDLIKLGIKVTPNSSNNLSTSSWP